MVFRFCRLFLLLVFLYPGKDIWAHPFKRVGEFIGPAGSGSVTALAKSPSDPNIVYCAFENAGILRSEDGGRSYHVYAKHSALTSSTITCIAVHPQNPNVVLAGGDSPDEYGYSRFTIPIIWRSDDGAKTWKPRESGYYGEYDSVHTIEFSPDNPDIVLAGVGKLRSVFFFSHPKPVLRSIDGGLTWSGVSSGFPGALRDTGVTSIHFDRLTANRVLLGFSSNYSSSNYGLYESLDSGKNWTKIEAYPFSDFLSKPILDILELEGPSQALFVGTSTKFYTGGNAFLYRSDDRGYTWTTATTELTTHPVFTTVFGLAHLEQDLIEPNTLWAIQSPPISNPDAIERNRYPLLKSTNLGMTWNPVIVNDKYHSVYTTNFQGIVVQGQQDLPRVLLGVQNEGLLEINQDGVTPVPIEQNLPFSRITQIADLQNSAPDLFATIHKTFRYETRNLSGNVTDNWGWQPTGTNDNIPSDTQKLLNSPDDSNRIFIIQKNQLYHSIDGGISWTDNMLSASMVWAGRPASNTYFANYGNTLFKSTDSGGTFTTVGTGLEGYAVTNLVTGPDPDRVVVAVNPYPSNPATAPGGVFVSDDGGMNFTRRMAGIDSTSSFPVRAVATNSDNPNVLIAGTYRNSIYRSEDSGNTWNRVYDIPLSVSSQVSKIVNNPTDGNEYLAATNWGLLYSSDAGQTWKQFVPELNYVPVTDLAIEQGTTGIEVFAATRTRGVWATKLSSGSSGIQNWINF